MDAHGDVPNGEPEYTRAPTVQDLKAICAWLNEEGARYAVVGGMAVNHFGFVRATMDIDLLVADDPENMAKVIRALGHLPDQAALELTPEEIQDYVVLRINDVITVDLLARACDVTLNDISVEIDHRLGLPIPYASPRDLIRMKQTIRPKDQEDCRELGRLHGL